MEVVEIRPQKWWFAIAAAVALLGVVVGVRIIVAGVRSIDDKIDDLARVDVNSGESVDVPAGTHRLWVESGPTFVRFDIVTTEGMHVPVQRTNSSFSYSFGSRRGESNSTITLDRPAALIVNEPSGSRGTVAFGENITSSLFTSIGLGVLVILGGIAIGIVMTIVIAVRRRNARRRLQPPPPTGGYYPPPQPYAQQSSLPPPTSAAPGPPSIPPPPPPPGTSFH